MGGGFRRSVRAREKSQVAANDDGFHRKAITAVLGGEKWWMSVYHIPRKVMMHLEFYSQ